MMLCKGQPGKKGCFFPLPIAPGDLPMAYIDHIHMIGGVIRIRSKKEVVGDQPPCGWLRFHSCTCRVARMPRR
jgi:hypothetical protein